MGAKAAADANDPRSCTMCGGTGRLARWKGWYGGRCFGCRGTGRVVVSTRTKCMEAIRAYLLPDGWGALSAAGRDRAEMALDAFSHIESTEPAQFDRMWVSIEAGRMDEVIAVLVTHYNTTFAQDHERT